MSDREVTSASLHLALMSLHVYLGWHAGALSSDAAMEQLSRSVSLVCAHRAQRLERERDLHSISEIDLAGQIATQGPNQPRVQIQGLSW